MKLVFEEISTKQGLSGISQEIMKKIREWDYIPSAICIQDTFDISYTSAYKLHLQLMKEKMKWEHYKKQYYPRRQRYPAFADILRTLWLLRNLSALSVWKQITKF